MKYIEYKNNNFKEIIDFVQSNVILHYKDYIININQDYYISNNLNEPKTKISIDLNYSSSPSRLTNVELNENDVLVYDNDKFFKISNIHNDILKNISIVKNDIFLNKNKIGFIKKNKTNQNIYYVNNHLTYHEIENLIDANDKIYSNFNEVKPNQFHLCSKNFSTFIELYLLVC